MIIEKNKGQFYEVLEHIEGGFVQLEQRTVNNVRTSRFFAYGRKTGRIELILEEDLTFSLVIMDLKVHEDVAGCENNMNRVFHIIKSVVGDRFIVRDDVPINTNLVGTDCEYTFDRRGTLVEVENGRKDRMYVNRKLCFVAQY